MDEKLRSLVRQRAGDRCEYCHLDEKLSPLAKLQIEHIRPKKHGGIDSPENLALACIHCNLHKGANLTGIDPWSGKVVQLFHPRKQIWAEHFTLNGCLLLGLSDVGRTTVRVLEMNSKERVRARVAFRE